MKKLFLLLLAIGCILCFCACDKVDEKDFEKKPAEVYSDMLQQTSTDFFGEDVGIVAFLRDLGEKYAVELAVEAGELEAYDISQVGAAVYVDSKNNMVVLRPTMTADNEQLSVNFWLNKAGITASGKSLFDNNNAYTLQFDTFLSEFKNSDLAALLALPDEDISELLTQLENAIDSASLGEKLELNDLCVRLCAIFNQVVTTEDADIDGTTAECIVSSFTLDSDNLAEALELIYDKLLKQYEAEDGEEDIREAVDEIIAEIKDAQMELNLKLYAEKKSGKLLKISCDGTFDEGELEMEGIFLGNKMSLELDVSLDDGNRAAFDLSLEKTVSEGVVTYRLKAITKDEDDDGYKSKNTLTMDLELEDGDFSWEVTSREQDNYEWSYDSFTGWYEDSYADSYVNDYESEFTVKGSYTLSKKELTLNIDSIRVDGERADVKIILAVSKNSDIPALPENATDIILMDEDALTEWLEDIAQSEFADLIAMLQ